MKANSKRKVFGDAVDLLMGDIEEVTMPRGVEMVPVKSIQPFHDHPFHLYEGERLEDMIASVKEHGVLNPVIVQKLDTGYEMLSGHNRWNAAKLAGIKEIPAIVKTDLSEEEAYVYVIETNLMQRSFSDLAISEKAAVLKARYEKEACQGKRNDILEEIARMEGKEVPVTYGHGDQRLNTRDMIGKEYELSGSSVGRLLKLNDLIKPFKDMVDRGALYTKVALQLAFLPENEQAMVYEIMKEKKTKITIEMVMKLRSHSGALTEAMVKRYVYIVIPKRDSHLLSMELLYTAITRAQKKVTIFLQEDIGTLSSLGHIEKSAVRRINSSVFKFAPLPEELLYIQNWYADEKKLATLSKYFVRSKSEVIIANMLVQEEVPFVYEEPLFAPDGTMFLPDFTVKFRGETYYWEHVGRLDLPDYRAHWEIKEKWYEKHFPGKLLTTFEGKDLSTDAMGIIKDHK